MKLKNKYCIIAIILVIIILFSVIISSINFDNKKEKKYNKTKKEKTFDKPCFLPDWKDGEYHDYKATTEKINFFNDKYPDLVEIKSIGRSVLEKNIWSICLTNEKNTDTKYSCLIDGCIHGCEFEAGEACLYLAEYLLINYDTNNTIKNFFNQSKINIIPLLNPDGRDSDSRFNDNGIDLCRNFDVDFGRLRGSAIRLGKILGFIKIPIIRIPFLGYVNNCGKRPLSEPETKALDKMMNDLKDEKFSFYLNCHTAVHNFFGPWSAYKPPFEIPNEKKEIFKTVGNWVEKNTEYENVELSYCASGTAVDWCFYKYDVPSFVFEILSKDYEPWLGGGKHDNLVHWMKTTLPVYIYLIENIESLYNWETPQIEPIMPDGIPPKQL